MKTNKVNVAFTLDKEVALLIKKYSKKQERNTSNLVNLILKDYIQKQKEVDNEDNNKQE